MPLFLLPVRCEQCAEPLARIQGPTPWNFRQFPMMRLMRLRAATTGIPSPCWGPTRMVTASSSAPFCHWRRRPTSSRSMVRWCRWSRSKKMAFLKAIWPGSRYPSPTSCRASPSTAPPHSLRIRIASPPRCRTLTQHLLAEGTHMRMYETLGAHLAQTRGPGGRSFRRLGAQCPARQRRRRFQPVGRPSPPDALPSRQRHLGTLYSRSGRGHALQVRNQDPLPGLYGQQGRSGGLLPVKCARRTPPSSGISNKYGWQDDEWLADARRAPGRRRADQYL